MLALQAGPKRMSCCRSYGDHNFCEKRFKTSINKAHAAAPEGAHARAATAAAERPVDGSPIGHDPTTKPPQDDGCSLHPALLHLRRELHSRLYCWSVADSRHHCLAASSRTATSDARFVEPHRQRILTNQQQLPQLPTGALPSPVQRCLSDFAMNNTG
ncbi:hypothetical protein cyc_00078 [Cyclospora cayetanensis]|uniref:Uncharacterized protein n=1 Tax=Cyclospora cayetanensis TaxID=88456 RepID=A0A1D3D1F4_9EIME|nr:hypothetical protein cyc_00078 [Cyclospora cayetanensis]